VGRAADGIAEAAAVVVGKYMFRKRFSDFMRALTGAPLKVQFLEKRRASWAIDSSENVTNQVSPMSLRMLDIFDENDSPNIALTSSEFAEEEISLRIKVVLWFVNVGFTSVPVESTTTSLHSRQTAVTRATSSVKDFISLNEAMVPIGT